MNIPCIVKSLHIGESYELALLFLKHLTLNLFYITEIRVGVGTNCSFLENTSLYLKTKLILQMNKVQSIYNLSSPYLSFIAIYWYILYI